MHSISIHPVGLEQVEQLQQIGRQTFFETFAASNSEANMRQYLQDSFSLEKLRVEVGDPATRFYFAQQGEQVIGYLKLNFGGAQTELKDDKALEIERIYVLNAYHGQKVGQLLYEKAIEVAQDAGVSYVWLGVWEENHRAIRFYEKNGFVAFDKHIFKLGDEAQTDIMMKMALDLNIDL